MPRRSFQRSLRQRDDDLLASAFQRWIGSTKPLGTLSPWSNTRAMRARSSGSDKFGIAGIDVGRQRRLPSAASARDPRRPAGCIRKRRRVSPRWLRRSARRRRCRPCAGPRWSRSDRDSSRSARRPCANRARTPSAAGFRPDTICPARNAEGRPARSASAAGGSARRPSPRLVGPTAAIFHSAASRSSTDTKVGSPPMVRRTSCCNQVGIDLLAELVEPRPGFVGERLCDPRRLADPLDVHLEAELDIGESDRAGDRRRRAVMRRGGDRDMPLAGQHARGDVEADPARAGKIDLGPGVQIGEIVLDLARPLDRIDVGTQLDEIAGDETRGEPEMPQRLDQQPGRIAARARARRQRLLRRLDRPAPSG